MAEILPFPRVRRRLSRDHDYPNFLKREADLKRRYPKRIALSKFGLDIGYRIGRRSYVGGSSPLEDGDPDGPWIRSCECTGWLLKDRKRVGGFVFNSYEVATFMSNDWFVEIMDRDSAYEANMACVLADAWEDLEEVTAYGELLELNSIWVSTEVSKVGLVGEIVRTMISAIDPLYAAFILKAFPLEYEGELSEAASLQLAFEKRRKAMMRYYASGIGVRALPGKHGNDGWMWMPSPRVMEYLPEPRDFVSS